MNSIDQPEPKPPSYDELLELNQALRQQLDELSAQNNFTWNILAETSRKLQVYSASIKAAVSSLLNNDIFWDIANQHEFLETIDSSVNQVSQLIVLLTLAFRAEAGNLVLRREAQALQEILSAALEEAATKYPNLALQISVPQEGKPVLLDYEYFVMVLRLLFEVFEFKTRTDTIQILASEGSSHWFLDFVGLSTRIIEIIHEMHHCKTTPPAIEYLPPEIILRLHIACEILHMQDIEVEIFAQPDHPKVLRLWIPAVKA